MKNLITILFITLLFVGCKPEKKEDKSVNHQNHQTEKKDTSKKKVLSPHTSTMAMIGDAHIHIDYSSPGVRNRMIFGGLLAYDMVWQAGAHKATWIETNKELTIAGNVLPAGKYGFFVIPSKEKWTIIFNSRWDQHGKDEYDIKEDIFRFKAIPEELKETTEHLKYKVIKTNSTTGTISLAWEKVFVEFPFIVTN